jgi:hypothetical protein
MQETRVLDRAGRPPHIERGLQQAERAEHIGLQERLRVVDRAVDMRLGRQMRDAREAMRFEQPADQRRVADVAFDEADAPIGD